MTIFHIFNIKYIKQNEHVECINERLKTLNNLDFGFVAI